MATPKEDLHREIEGLPEAYAREVLHFVRYLKLHSPTRADPAALTEPALARDWDLPEEDEAWAHL